MKIRQRTNFVWGLVFLAVALAVLLHALDILPAGIYDLVSRSWPAVLVLVGLSLFLRDRVRFGSFAALVVTGALVAGVAAVAFSTRVTQNRDDFQMPVEQAIPPEITLLRVSVTMLDTDVELVRSLQDRTVTGQFVGSAESHLTIDYTEPGGGAAALTVTETRPNTFPMLEAVGRGRLRLELPAGVPLDVSFIGDGGAVSLNMLDLAVERLNMDLRRGDALVTVPAYDPQGSADDATLGVLQVRDGNITVFVPSEVGARFELQRGGSGFDPLYDALIYNYLVGDILEARNIDDFAIKMRYVITAPRGVISVATAGA